MKFYSAFLVFVSVHIFSCSESKKVNGSVLDSSVYQFPPTHKVITDKRIEEASGLFASKNFPGYLWTHNDSGDTARLLLISPLAKVVAEVYLEGVLAVDWEEIGGYATEDTSYLIIGDIGDNKAERKFLTFYKIKEPASLDSIQLIPLDSISRMQFTYPEGARDAEAFFYDQYAEQIVLITKREEYSWLYSFTWNTGTKQVPKSMGRLFSRNFTAADQSSEGAILLKNYESIYYWPPSQQAAGLRMLQEKPLEIPYVMEPQGEAICFDTAGNFFALSEFNKNTTQKIYHYIKKE